MKDEPETELVANVEGDEEGATGTGSKQQRTPQDQQDYLKMMGFGRSVKKLEKGDWLKQELEKKWSRLGVSDPMSLPVSEESILLQERLPDDLDNFKEPIKQWIECTEGGSGIPGWNKKILPEEVLERPPTPVKVDHSIHQWIVREKEAFLDQKDTNDETLYVSEQTVIRVSKKALERLKRQDVRGRERGSGRDAHSRNNDSRGRASVWRRGSNSPSTNSSPEVHLQRRRRDRERESPAGARPSSRTGHRDDTRSGNSHNQRELKRSRSSSYRDRSPRNPDTSSRRSSSRDFNSQSREVDQHRSSRHSRDSHRHSRDKENQGRDLRDSHYADRRRGSRDSHRDRRRSPERGGTVLARNPLFHEPSSRHSSSREQKPDDDRSGRRSESRKSQDSSSKYELNSSSMIKK